MKKTLIALAVAGFVAAPAAMADVTVYGQAHISLDNVSGDGGIFTATTDLDEQTLAVTNRASRVGVKAAEDIGGGLTAVAQMEFGVDMVGDTADVITARNQIIGLAGSFGTVALGRHDTPYKMSTGSLDVFADTAADYNAIIGTPAGLELRAPDVVAYLSPDMNGFSVQAAIVALNSDGDDTDNDDDDAADATSIAVQYKNGPLFLAAAAESFAADDTPAGTRLGAGYDFGMAKVGFVYETVTDVGLDTDDDGLADTLDDHTAMLVNVAVPMGGNTLIAEYGQRSLDDADVDVTLAAIGLAHGFSKNTSGYVAYGNVNVDNGGSDPSGSTITAGMVVKF